MAVFLYEVFPDLPEKTLEELEKYILEKNITLAPYKKALTDGYRT